MKKTLVEDLRRRCADYIIQHGYNELARLSGVNPTNVFRFVRDNKQPSGQTVDRLATALGLELSPPYKKRISDKKRTESLPRKD